MKAVESPDPDGGLFGAVLHVAGTELFAFGGPVDAPGVVGFVVDDEQIVRGGHFVEDFTMRATPLLRPRLSILRLFFLMPQISSRVFCTAYSCS